MVVHGFIVIKASQSKEAVNCRFVMYAKEGPSKENVTIDHMTVISYVLTP